jgi:hypothetical protein
MEKIAQENAVLSKDLESLIREVEAMSASNYIYSGGFKFQPMIFTPIFTVNLSTKVIDECATL